MIIEHPVHVTVKGHGETILFLHAAGSSGMQWEKAASHFSSQYRVVIPDLYGEGRTPALDDWTDLLRKETELVCRLAATDSVPVHIVGHSYGGVLAMTVAREFPWLVKSLTLIEPVAFHLLRNKPSDPSLEDLWHVKTTCSEAVSAKDNLAAAKAFVSYWSGLKSWDFLNPATQGALACGMLKVVTGWEAICNKPQNITDYNSILIPTLLVSGDKSPLPIRWVVQQLFITLKNPFYVEIPNAGHMSPVTHSRQIITALESHFQRINEWYDAAG